MAIFDQVPQVKYMKEAEKLRKKLLIFYFLLSNVCGNVQQCVKL